MSGEVADAKELFWLAGGALSGLALWVGWVLATAETREGPLVRASASEAAATDTKAGDQAADEADDDAAGGTDDPKP